jgi:hypothetical protein
LNYSALAASLTFVGHTWYDSPRCMLCFNSACKWISLHYTLQILFLCDATIFINHLSMFYIQIGKALTCKTMFENLFLTVVILVYAPNHFTPITSFSPHRTLIKLMISSGGVETQSYISSQSQIYPKLLPLVFYIENKNFIVKKKKLY